MANQYEKELEASQKKEIETNQGEPIVEGVMFVPQLDIAENGDSIKLVADLPGVKPDGVDIDVREGVLTLTAKVDPYPDKQKLIYQEYEIGGYQRRFTLGERIDVGKINAKMDNGELTLVLPKAEEHKPRKIEVK